jgi:hypothetical protein
MYVGYMQMLYKEFELLQILVSICIGCRDREGSWNLFPEDTEGTRYPCVEKVIGKLVACTDTLER